MTHHESCSLSPASGPFRDEEVELPFRLLYITGDSGAISVRLVETHGSSGAYCALSHCWGAVDKRPPRTTRSTLRDHLAGIPFDHLPSTFRDAITLVRGLNMNYLWIDSLCIVQDDGEEWLQESAKMGLIYQRATLVIVAAGSKDSTEGLFITKRPEPFIFRFPYVAKDGSAKGSYNVAILPKDSNMPPDGPLRKRAWAFQEWYFSRRNVFFMPGGLTWKCNKCSLNERGEYVDLGLYEAFSWLIFLGEYSGKELTYPSDRLIAIRGIVSEMQKSRNDSFRFGVWEDQLPEQLVWTSDSPQQNNLPNLPSWSWAATGGSKYWVLERRDNKSQTVALTFDLMDSGSLKASGPLLRARIAQSPVLDCCIHALEERDKSFRRPVGVASIELMMLPGYIHEPDDVDNFLILDADEINSVLGLARFDRLGSFSEVYCFILVSTERDIEDPW